MAGKSESRKKPVKKASIWKRRLKQATAFGFIVFLTAFAGLFMMFLLKLREAEEALRTPEFQDRMDAVSRPPTRIMTRDNVEIYRVSSENRQPIKNLEDIPEHVRQAILAAEDKRFYQHPGVDSTGLMRAFVSIFKDGRVSQGGSTLTMQLAKLLYNGNERSFRRKVEDIAYAYAIEKYKTKDQILLLYLNKVYFGENAHGIKAAAKVYFNKDVKDLSVGEAAMLARSVQRPSQYNPFKNLDESLKDRNTVASIMLTEGWITKDQYEKAINEKPKLNPNPPKTTAFRAGFGQHFVQHVLESIKQDMPDLDLNSGGYTIYTTIDSNLQKHAEKVLRDVVAKNNNNYRKVNQGAFVAMNREGQIIAEVGGVDFNRNQYNIVTQGQRQPGSSFKAFVYAVGFQTGAIFGPEDHVSNAVIARYDPWSRETWRPRNSASWETASSYSARKAFAASINRCAIHLIDEVGPQTVVQAARDSFGIKSKLEPVSPLALGSSAVRPLEMLEAYGVFMLGGDRVKPYPVTRIVAPDGEVVRQYQPQKYMNVFSSSAIANMDVLMRDVVVAGTARAAQPVPNARGKTGTTNSHLDAWFCGYTDGIVGIAWVGNQNSKGLQIPMGSSTFGGTVSAEIWAGVMKEAYKKYGGKNQESQPATFASAIPPIQRTDEETVPALQQELPTTRSVEERIVPPDVNTPPTDGTSSVPPTPVVDQAEIERQRLEAERRAEQEREREIQRLIAAERERERQRAREADRRRNDSNVQLSICADSGMIANMYCPETVTRAFRRDRAPNRSCRLHGPG